jgi:hypothetical protein
MTSAVFDSTTLFLGKRAGFKFMPNSWTFAMIIFSIFYAF